MDRDALQRALSEAIGPALPEDGVASRREAKRVVEAATADALDEALAEVRRSLVDQLLARREVYRQRREAEAERERLGREREKQTVTKAKQVWQELYGGKVADKLEPFVRYRVLETAGLVVAVPEDDEQFDRVDRFIRRTAGKTHGVRSGVALGKLSARIAAVAADADEALELLAGARHQEQKGLELEKQRERQAEREAIRLAHEERLYGVRPGEAVPTGDRRRHGISEDPL